MMDDAAHVKFILNHATVTSLPGCMTPSDRGKREEAPSIQSD